MVEKTVELCYEFSCNCSYADNIPPVLDLNCNYLEVGAEKLSGGSLKSFFYTAQDLWQTAQLLITLFQQQMPKTYSLNVLPNINITFVFILSSWGCLF